MYRNSSVFNKVFNFLLGSRFYNINSREWKDLCNCQINPGIYSDTPFLKATAELLNNIIPIAFGRQRSLFNGFKKNLDKSVNAEISLRQASRASATNRDQNFVSWKIFRSRWFGRQINYYIFLYNNALAKSY